MEKKSDKLKKREWERVRITWKWDDEGKRRRYWGCVVTQWVVPLCPMPWAKCWVLGADLWWFWVWCVWCEGPPPLTRPWCRAMRSGAAGLDWSAPVPQCTWISLAQLIGHRIRPHYHKQENHSALRFDWWAWQVHLHMRLITLHSHRFCPKSVNIIILIHMYYYYYYYVYNNTYYY